MKIFTVGIFCFIALLIINESVKGANTDQVDFIQTQLDSLVKDIMWCGQNNEAILVLTEGGVLQRSRDRGLTWKKMQSYLGQSAAGVLDQGQEMGTTFIVTSMMQSPVDDSLVVLIGDKGINWVTSDCGANFKALNSGKNIHEFQFHPTERDWALAATWTACEEFIDEPCKIYKELYVTKDLGTSWEFMKEYVYDFAWAYSKAVPEAIQRNPKLKLPKERIFITHEPSATGHQNKQQKTWSTAVNLYVSDDFFLTKKIALSNGNSLIKTDNYIFCAKATKDEMVGIYVSSVGEGFLNFQQAKLPKDSEYAKTFTVMDTSEKSVFLHIQTEGLTSLGNVYISDGSGRQYSESLKNVLRGTEYVDFEKINSLEGVFLANVNIQSKSKRSVPKKMKDPKMAREVGQFEEEENELEKLQKNQESNINVMNEKQRKTKKSMNKNREEYEGRSGELLDKTYITHNKGGKWDLLKAPTVDSLGEPINCFIEDGCSLHLQIYSSNGIYPPPYSQDSAVGIIVAVGNVGRHLERTRVDRQNTYLSRDGGLTWNEVIKGSYIYELGDHGGLIVMAANTKQTNEILFSYNEGKSWHTMTISDSLMDITNIIIEPLSISQQFVVYGSYFKKDDPNPKGALITLDFKDLHEPQCRGVDNPGTVESDYEIWTPFDGRHGENKCYLGQQINYIRRKQDSECFNGEELERQIFRQFCPCTDMDYECDTSYMRTEEGRCIKDSDDTQYEKSSGLSDDQKEQCNQMGFYTISQGYRRIPGDLCTINSGSGVDLNPKFVACGVGSFLFGIISFKTLLEIIVLIAILYYGWPIIEKILIVLPVPDPKELKDNIKGKMDTIVQKSKDMIKSKKSQNEGKGGYTTNFDNAPQSLEEEDDQEDDVGKPVKQQTNGGASKRSHSNLNFGSDEENDANELISLDDGSNKINRDRTNTAADKIPKLQKPVNQ